MHKPPRPLLGVFSLFACLLLGSDASAQAPKKDAKPKLADYFGFQALEIYKLEHRIGNLMLKDLDGDKIDDIVVSDNARSRIDLLLSTKKPDDDQSNRPFRKDPNDLQYDHRMRLAQHPGEQGSRQHGHRRLQRGRQARPGLLRDAGRGRDPLQRGVGPVRQPEDGSAPATGSSAPAP